MTDPKKVKLPDGTTVERNAESDEAADMLSDVDHFGESIEFDEQGHRVTGPKLPAPAHTGR